MKITIDGRQIEDLEQTLAKATAGTAREVEAVVVKGAVNIKKDAARRISGLAHARAYPRSINFDKVKNLSTGPAADIGPDKSRPQGALGNILEYGTVNNPPHPHMRPAAAAELPRFEKALLEVADPFRRSS